MTYEEWIDENNDRLLDEAEAKGIDIQDDYAFENFCSDKYESLYPIQDDCYE